MVGCGVQGNAQIAMMHHALPDLQEIYIIDSYPPAMDELIARQQPHSAAKIIIARSFEEIAQKCDVICSAAIITEKPDPKFRDEWFHEGQTILTSDCHTFYEDKTMKRADKYLLDSIEQHELLAANGYYPDGLPLVYGETGEVLAGIKPGREHDREFIVCNNVGMAVEDMMLARRIFDLSLSKGVGRKIAL
ncbi:MAG: ornithine cyclodeaminase family protein, partial [Coriobacteriia bacterium]|nr:ornithine cyclodeaminase family protein [Coriobacteriia bacterium]